MNFNEYKSADYWETQRHTRNRPATRADFIAGLVLTITFPIAYTVVGILENL